MDQPELNFSGNFQCNPCWIQWETIIKKNFRAAAFIGDLQVDQVDQVDQAPASRFTYMPFLEHFRLFQEGTQSSVALGDALMGWEIGCLEAFRKRMRQTWEVPQESTHL